MKRCSRQKWLFLTAVLAFSFAPGVVRAQALSINGSVAGALDKNHASDIYSVTIPADGNITVTATPASTLRVYLYFYDTDGVSAVAGAPAGGFGAAVTMTVPHLGPGKYYVGVYRYDGSGGYTLSDTFARQPIPNDTEPDDAFTQTTTSLAVGKSTTGRLGYSRTSYSDVDAVDYYKVVIPADGDLTVRVTPSPTLRVYLYFYDTDGVSAVAGAPPGGFGATVPMTVAHLGPGTYYVGIYRYDGYGGYTLDSFWNRQPIANDSEPNDTYQTAIPFTSGTGHLGYSRTSYKDRDTADFYALTGSGTLSVTAQPTSTLRISLLLYNAGGGEIAHADGSDFGAAVTLTVKNLPAGNYFVAVLRYDGYGAYTFSGAVPVSISGIVTLQSCQNQTAIPIRFQFRPADGSPSFDLTAFLAADGSYTLPGVLPKNYSLAIKGRRWLQKVISGVNASGGSVTGVNATLVPGDINNDNKVNITDLGLLSDAFNSQPGALNWNVQADLNCDGKVDITDLGILADNFNKNGDP
jgi:hypothetical protein